MNGTLSVGRLFNLFHLWPFIFGIYGSVHLSNFQRCLKNKTQKPEIEIESLCGGCKYTSGGANHLPAPIQLSLCLPWRRKQSPPIILPCLSLGWRNVWNVYLHCEDSENSMNKSQCFSWKNYASYISGWEQLSSEIDITSNYPGLWIHVRRRQSSLNPIVALFALAKNTESTHFSSLIIRPYALRNEWKE